MNVAPAGAAAERQAVGRQPSNPPLDLTLVSAYSIDSRYISIIVLIREVKQWTIRRRNNIQINRIKVAGFVYLV
jgi:hypothetical protein